MLYSIHTHTMQHITGHALLTVKKYPITHMLYEPYCFMVVSTCYFMLALVIETSPRKDANSPQDKEFGNVFERGLRPKDTLVLFALFNGLWFGVHCILCTEFTPYMSEE